MGDTFASIEDFRQAAIDAGVTPATAEHIGRESDQHFPDDYDGVEHWRLPCHKVNDDGDVEVVKVGFWKDPLGRLGTAGTIYLDRVNGAANRVKPIVKEQDTTSLGARALVLASELTKVWSAWIIDSKPDCVIVGCYIESSESIVKASYAVREDGDSLEIKPYIEAAA